MCSSDLFSKQSLRFVHMNLSVALSPEALERMKNGEMPKKACNLKSKKKTVEVL